MVAEMNLPGAMLASRVRAVHACFPVVIFIKVIKANPGTTEGIHCHIETLMGKYPYP
jgi:hypothetical protein